MKRSEQSLEGFGFLFVLALIVTAVAGAYMSCEADCDNLGWMPAKDVPARCLREALPR